MDAFEKEGTWEPAQLPSPVTPTPSAGCPIPGIVKRSFGGEHMTYIRYRFESGATFPLHRHPQEQLCLVERGMLQCHIDDEVVSLTPERAVIISQNVPHTMTAGEDGALLSCILSPPRTSQTEYQAPVPEARP